MKKPHIGITYPDYISISFEETIRKDIAAKNLQLEFIREGPKLWASIEWAIPGLIAAYIFKTYFDSFLQEAAKDHYTQLKKALNRLLSQSKNSSTQTFIAKTSTHKVDKSNSQSKAISIYFELKDNRKIKLMFDNNLLIEDWTDALDKILSILDNHYHNFPNDKLSKSLVNLEKDPRHEIYAYIDLETKEWVFSDLRMLVNKSM